MMLLLPLAASAQTRAVHGTVTSSEDGAPLPGATIVVIDNPTIGTSTDFEGRYELSGVPEGSTLRFSYIGYLPQEVAIEDRTVLDVALAPDQEQLDEIVVVGYGSQVEREVTGNIARISAEELQNTGATTFESGMQGRAPGVVVQNSSGKLGQGVQVRVRGGSSVSADNQPLYVIDGVPVITDDLSSNGAPTNPLAQISPSDIQSIDVLKDAASAAIYGARGSNGVVLVTTKKGYEGSTQFSVNYRHSASEPTGRPDMLNAEEYVELFREAAANRGKYDYNHGNAAGYASEQEAMEDWQTWADGYWLDWLSGGTNWRACLEGGNCQVDTDWTDLSFQNAFANVIDVSARGGDERTQFFASGSYSDEKGVVFRDALDRITGRLNLDHKANDFITLGGGLSLSRVLHNRVSNDNSFANPMQLIAMPPITPLHTPDPETPLNEDGYYEEYRPTDELNGGTLYFNSRLYKDNVRYETMTYRVLGNGYVGFQLTDDLRLRSEVGVDVLDQNEDEYYNRKVARNTGASEGLGINTWNRVASLTNSNVLTYTKSFGQHDVEATGGTEVQLVDNDEVYVQGEKFPTDDFTQIQSAAEITGGTSNESSYRFLSYFTRLNYKFKDRYLLMLSGRYDGSSRFGANSRYGFFPAVSAGWIVSDEPFMESMSTISFLKLRGSVGLTGNAAISNFGHLPLWGASNYNSRSGLYPIQVANPDLQWERTAQYDIGFDLHLFNGRVRSEVAYYRKETTDLLLNVNLPLTSGYASQLKNVGALKNEGLEFALRTDNILTENFSWSTSFNISTNRNEVVDLDGQVIEGGYINRAVEGEPIGVFFGYEYAGVNPDNGDALYYVNATDENGNIVDPKATTNDPNEANRVVIGSPHPDFSGGLGNQFAYKGLELDVFVQFVQGNEIYDGGGRYKTASGSFYDNQLSVEMDRWQKPGDQTDVPEARLYLDNGTAPSSRYLYDGSYVRLKTVTLAYNVPERLTRGFNLSNTRVYVTGNNLLTATDYPWWDPEVNADYISGNIGLGNEFYSAPQTRTITGGVQFTF